MTWKKFWSMQDWKGDLMATKITKVEPETTLPRFSKKQITSAKKYRVNIDLVSSLLADDGLYTLAEVDDMIDKFLKGKVK